MDGNFKAEHLHDWNSDDQVSLMDGLGFMVSQNPYKSYLSNTSTQHEVTTPLPRIPPWLF